MNNNIVQNNHHPECPQLPEREVADFILCACGEVIIPPDPLPAYDIHNYAIC